MLNYVYAQDQLFHGELIQSEVTKSKPKKQKKHASKKKKKKKKKEEKEELVSRSRSEDTSGSGTESESESKPSKTVPREASVQTAYNSKDTDMPLADSVQAVEICKQDEFGPIPPPATDNFSVHSYEIFPTSYTDTCQKQASSLLGEPMNITASGDTVDFTTCGELAKTTGKTQVEQVLNTCEDGNNLDKGHIVVSKIDHKEIKFEKGHSESPLKDSSSIYSPPKDNYNSSASQSCVKNTSGTSPLRSSSLRKRSQSLPKSKNRLSLSRSDKSKSKSLSPLKVSGRSKSPPHKRARRSKSRSRSRSVSHRQSKQIQSRSQGRRRLSKSRSLSKTRRSKSRSLTRTHQSRSRTPRHNKRSNSRSLARNKRSKSRSDKKTRRSVSRSPRRKRSTSRSSKRKKSKSQSPRRKRSESRSVRRWKSKSRSPRRRRSESRSLRRRRSKSRSQRRGRSRSSRWRRSKSRSVRRRRSDSRSTGRNRSKSHSERRHRSASRSARRHRSASRSTRRHRSNSRSARRHRSKSRSPRRHRSKSHSPRRHRSRSRSLRRHRSRSRSLRRRRSRTRSSRRHKSKSRSPRRNRSRSRSARRIRSRSRSARRIRSRSRSAWKNRSRSRSTRRNRSRSHSPRRNRSQSLSPQRNRSKSPSPKRNRSKSKSQTPKQNIESKSRSPQRDKCSETTSPAKKSSKGKSTTESRRPESTSLTQVRQSKSPKRNETKSQFSNRSTNSRSRSSERQEYSKSCHSEGLSKSKSPKRTEEVETPLSIHLAKSECVETSLLVHQAKSESPATLTPKSPLSEINLLKEKSPEKDPCSKSMSPDSIYGIEPDTFSTILPPPLQDSTSAAPPCSETISNLAFQCATVDQHSEENPHLVEKSSESESCFAADCAVSLFSQTEFHPELTPSDVKMQSPETTTILSKEQMPEPMTAVENAVESMSILNADCLKPDSIIPKDSSASVSLINPVPCVPQETKTEHTFPSQIHSWALFPQSSFSSQLDYSEKFPKSSSTVGGKSKCSSRINPVFLSTVQGRLKFDFVTNLDCKSKSKQERNSQLKTPKIPASKQELNVSMPSSDIHLKSQSSTGHYSTSLVPVTYGAQLEHNPDLPLYTNSVSLSICSNSSSQAEAQVGPPTQPQVFSSELCQPSFKTDRDSKVASTINETCPSWKDNTDRKYMTHESTYSIEAGIDIKSINTQKTGINSVAPDEERGTCLYDAYVDHVDKPYTKESSTSSFKVEISQISALDQRQNSPNKANTDPVVVSPRRDEWTSPTKKNTDSSTISSNLMKFPSPSKASIDSKDTSPSIERCPSPMKMDTDSKAVSPDRERWDSLSKGGTDSKGASPVREIWTPPFRTCTNSKDVSPSRDIWLLPYKTDTESKDPTCICSPNEADTECNDTFASRERWTSFSKNDADSKDASPNRDKWESPTKVDTSCKMSPLRQSWTSPFKTDTDSKEISPCREIWTSPSKTDTDSKDMCLIRGRWESPSKTDTDSKEMSPVRESWASPLRTDTDSKDMSSVGERLSPYRTDNDSKGVSPVEERWASPFRSDIDPKSLSSVEERYMSPCRTDVYFKDTSPYTDDSKDICPVEEPWITSCKKNVDKDISDSCLSSSQTHGGFKRMSSAAESCISDSTVVSSKDVPSVIETCQSPCSADTDSKGITEKSSSSGRDDMSVIKAKYSSPDTVPTLVHPVLNLCLSTFKTIIDSAPAEDTGPASQVVTALKSTSPIGSPFNTDKGEECIPAVCKMRSVPRADIAEVIKPSLQTKHHGECTTSFRKRRSTSHAEFPEDAYQVKDNFFPLCKAETDQNQFKTDKEHKSSVKEVSPETDEQCMSGFKSHVDEICSPGEDTNKAFVDKRMEKHFTSFCDAELHEEHLSDACATEAAEKVCHVGKIHPRPTVINEEHTFFVNENSSILTQAERRNTEKVELKLSDSELNTSEMQNSEESMSSHDKTIVPLHSYTLTAEHSEIISSPVHKDNDEHNSCANQISRPCQVQKELEHIPHNGQISYPCQKEVHLSQTAEMYPPCASFANVKDSSPKKEAYSPLKEQSADDQFSEKMCSERGNVSDISCTYPPCDLLGLEHLPPTTEVCPASQAVPGVDLVPSVKGDPSIYQTECHIQRETPVRDQYPLPPPPPLDSEVSCITQECSSKAVFDSAFITPVSEETLNTLELNLKDIKCKSPVNERSKSSTPSTSKSMFEPTTKANRSKSRSPSTNKRIYRTRRSKSRSPPLKKHAKYSRQRRSNSTTPAKKARSKSRSRSKNKKSKSRSPVRKKRSKSKSVSRKRRSRSPVRKKSRSRSSARKKSRSRSPTRKKSRSRSPARKKKSKSVSPVRIRSKSLSPIRKRSKSRSPVRKKISRSRTPNKKRRSRSRSPAKRKRTRSRSLTRTRQSKSRSPKRKRSRSRSTRKRYSRSPKKTKRSKSRSPTRKRRSKSADKNKRSKSKSLSRSNIRQKRSRSKKRSRTRSLSKHRKKSRSVSRDRKSRSPERRRRSSSRDTFRRGGRSRYRSRSIDRWRRSRSFNRRRAASRSPVLLLRRRRSGSRNRRSPSKTPPRLTELDKAQLLEIAKANAAAMCAKAGMPIPDSLKPAAILQLPLPPPVPQLVEEKKKVVQKASVITIQELTEKCKQIAESKEDENEVINKPHVSDDEDEEQPFTTQNLKLGEIKGISFSLSNASVKPAAKTEVALTKEFPVSSGSQHRKKEGDGAYGEWVPVDKGTEKENKDNVFSDTPVQPVDITLAMTERAMAQKRLLENPFDVDAICMLSRAQEQVDAWAQSNNLPGRFTGSTGAQVLSSEELSSSGPQAWIRKDQFLRAAPVAGGVGEFLMKKMGWREGEGLGKNREGNVEPILIDFKTDRKGLVAEGEKTQKSGSLVAMKEILGKHPVSALMEICNKRKWSPPEFALVHDSGPDHRKNFLFKVMINGKEYKPSMASPNKKHAKAMAATAALQAMGQVSRDGIPNGPTFTSATN
ncbi:serine/arginine repetitive matrix protein 2-like isoform X2 [Erpetoichthys calabaricus]|uniref:serine/arginine repetitive matrix protein 2-like isoform X2 n=1 Tax=Erpetoichthys calabaricus TaxID=27687 RepID=UPI002234589B|nr:serine/arginine repetitive matrix protein 2-like isoform X2 [Erpetoichthys calabaricus]